MKNGIIFLLLALLALSVVTHDRRPIAMIEDTRPNGRELRPADFQQCVTVRNGPLRPPVHNGPYRHERGIA